MPLQRFLWSGFRYTTGHHRDSSGEVTKQYHVSFQDHFQKWAININNLRNYIFYGIPCYCDSYVVATSEFLIEKIKVSIDLQSSFFITTSPAVWKIPAVCGYIMEDRFMGMSLIVV